MYTVKVGLTDNEMKFLNQPPKLWNGNKERVRLAFEGPGIEKDANFAVRFSDGTEVAAPYGKCFVPDHLFNNYEFGFEAVTDGTVSNTLTVELKPGEKGLYTLVEGVKDGEVLVDMDISTTNGGGSSGMYHGPFKGFKPEVGKEYKVTFDGVEYTETAELFRGGYPAIEGLVSLGYDENVYCADENDLQFVYLYDPNTDEAKVYASTWDKHHITVVEPYEQPVAIVSKKLSEKVLPNAGGGQFMVTFSEDDDGNLAADKTFAEVEAALSAGMGVGGVIIYQSGARMYLSLMQHVPETAIAFEMTQYIPPINVFIIACFTIAADDSVTPQEYSFVMPSGE